MYFAVKCPLGGARRPLDGFIVQKKEALILNRYFLFVLAGYRICYFKPPFDPQLPDGYSSKLK